MRINDLIDDINSRIEPSVEVDPQRLQVWLKRHFYRCISLIQRYNSDRFNKVIEINILNSVQEYKMPDDCLRITHANLTSFDEAGNKVLGGDMREINYRDIKNIGGDNQYEKGTCYYARDKNIGIYPKPTLNSLSKIRVWYSYQPEFNDDSLDLLSLDIQLTLSDGVVAEYLSQDNQYGASDNQIVRYEKRMEKLCREFANAVSDSPKNLIRDSARYGYDNYARDKDIRL